MLTFFIKKLGVIIPTFLGVTLIAFTFIRLLPGDPVLVMAGERGMTEERHARLMAEYGFDKPIIVQLRSLSK
jgi:dipeptide transport system permease protein